MINHSNFINWYDGNMFVFGCYSKNLFHLSAMRGESLGPDKRPSPGYRGHPYASTCNIFVFCFFFFFENMVSEVARN